VPVVGLALADVAPKRPSAVNFWTQNECWSATYTYGAEGS
jgi:hypothetical protein